MNFDSYLNKALDSLEKSVVEPLSKSAVEIVDEYPKPSAAGDNTASVAPSAVTSAKRCMEFWKDFDLENQRLAWDKKGMEITSMQENARAARQGLADQAEAAQGDMEARADMVPLLLQELTRSAERSKVAEAAFMQMYKVLSEAPDPLHELRMAAELTGRVAEADGAGRKLAKELEVAQKDAAQVSSLRQQVRRLEERNGQLEEELELRADQLAQQREQEGARDVEILLERERMQVAELEQARSTLKEVKGLHDRTEEQLFSLRAATDDDRAARQNELDMAAEEVERATHRALALERERQKLAEELSSLRSLPNSREPATAAAAAAAAEGGVAEATESILEASVVAKERVISRLHAELQSLEHTLSEEREQHSHTVQLLHQQVDDKNRVVEALRTQLQDRPSHQHVESLRQRLAMLQAMVEADEAFADRGGEGGDAAAGAQAALRDKNKKLRDELTTLRRTHAAAREAGEGLVRQVEALSKDKVSLAELVQRLEDDLVRAAEGGRARGAGDGDGGAAGAGEGGDGGGAGAAAEAGMVEIVCGQRERFRARVLELEEQAAQHQEAAGRTEAALQAATADNVKLYEKIRYLQRYSQQKVVEARRAGGTISVDADGVPVRGKASDSRYSCGVGPVQVSLGGGEEDGLMRRRASSRFNCFGGGDVEVGAGVGSSEAEAKYKKEYEERLNPFSAFARMEEEESTIRLRPHDRIALMAGKFLLGSRAARLFATIYFLGIHLFVMMLLFSSAGDNTIEYVDATDAEAR